MKRVDRRQLSLGEEVAPRPKQFVPVWNDLVDGAERTKGQIEKVYSLIYYSGAGVGLWDAYESLWGKYQLRIESLRAICPDCIQWFGAKVDKEAGDCRRKLDLLWPTSAATEKNRDRFMKLLVRYTLLERQARILPGG